MMRGTGKTATAVPETRRLGLVAEGARQTPAEGLTVGLPGEASAYSLAGDDLDALAVYCHWQNFRPRLDDRGLHTGAGIRLD